MSSSTTTRAKGPGYPHPSSPLATTIMRSNPSKDTGPELRLRSALHRAGLRFRVHHAIRVDQRRPIVVDIAFPGRRLAVFVDGCFWHDCPTHGVIPQANRAYWEPKLRRTRERDVQVVARLARAGWLAVRIWEHEDISAAAERVVEAWALRPPRRSGHDAASSAA